MRALAIALALLLVLAGGTAWWQHRAAVDARAAAAAAQADAATAAWEASAANANVKIIEKFTDRVRVVHDTTHAIQQEIPRYVTPDADRRYPLPVGFVWVHDAAAAGVPLGDRPEGADAPSADVTASAASAVIVGNYGICHETAEQLTALQDFVRTHLQVEP